ncbi:MAG: hypothetical protein IJ662_01885 [Clostridia bacterium]|nr:hypothetical protein [Clostridia bacterium]
MNKRKKRGDESLNFWQPASDLLSALLLVLMLVILLLGLYLVHIPENSEIDPYYGDALGGGDNESGGASPLPTAFFWTDGDDDGGGDGGGGDGRGRQTPVILPDHTPSASPTYTPTPSPTPDLPGGGAAGGGGGEGGGNGQGEGPGDQPDAGLKSAVFVMLVDAETDRTIKEANVEFELYEENGALQILNTYYPERITFRSYVTTESGAFYFPEKLLEGAYILHELTEPAGYDAAPNQPFLLDQAYDWPDPYVVRVPVYPSRNVIRVQMTDAETGLAVAGGSFEVVADENIVTADGTLRYRAGQTVTEIRCGEDGYGVSEEIYLGRYVLRQKEIPAYYASYPDEVAVEVSKKSSVEPPLQWIASQRTKIRLTVADELYPTRGVEGAAFTVRWEGGVSPAFAEAVTDSTGSLILDTIEKATVYHILQTGAPDQYQPARAEQTVAVTADGRIGGETETEIALTNRMIRVSVGITDEFSSVQVPGVSLALYSEDGALIRAWTTTGSPQSFTDLKPGSYFLIKDGEEDSRYPISVRDQAEIQTINIHTTYVMRYVIIGAVAAAALAAAAALILVIRKRRKARG